MAWWTDGQRESHLFINENWQSDIAENNLFITVNDKLRLPILEFYYRQSDNLEANIKIGYLKCAGMNKSHLLNSPKLHFHAYSRVHQKKKIYPIYSFERKF